MILRQTVTCNSCESGIVVRVGIGPATRRRTIFQCPHCGVALHLDVDTPPGTTEIKFVSQDVTNREPDSRKDDGLPAVVLYTDLPVHRSLLGKKASDSYESPFLHMSSLWGERTPEYAAKSNVLSEMHDSVLPAIRRAASLVQGGDFGKLAIRTLSPSRVLAGRQV